MTYPHRIRLRGPWECEPLARADDPAPLPPRRRMALPCRWSDGGLGDFAGRVRFRRRFGFPARLDAFERVWLTFGGAAERAEVSLNGHSLGSHVGPGPFEFEVTSLLQFRNELVVEVEGPAPNGGLEGEVALEARCTAYLGDLRLQPEIEEETARLTVSGLVIGTAERPLELYLLLDGRTVGYGTIEAAAEGTAFALTSEELPPERWRRSGSADNPPHHVRVDLVNVATVWYQFEQFCDFTEPPPASEAGTDPDRAGD